MGRFNRRCVSRGFCIFRICCDLKSESGFHSSVHYLRDFALFSCPLSVLALGYGALGWVVKRSWIHLVLAVPPSTAKGLDEEDSQGFRCILLLSLCVSPLPR